MDAIHVYVKKGGKHGKTWREQYIECIINVFSHLRNKHYI
jgi:hypothetical protein